MSKVTIEAAGQELDLAKGIGFGLNYAIDDVKKVESKNSNYSKTITLAGSKNNNKLLGGLFDINADFTFFNPNFKVEAKIIRDSSTVLEGFLQLKSIEKDTDNFQDGNLIVYKCVISSKTVDFQTDIKDKKLEDLDFSRFDHEYSYDNITNSWTHTSADAYVYPLLYKGSNSYSTRDFKPAIFHKAYLKRIAQEAGYTLSGSLMDESTIDGLHYSKEIIPFNGDLPQIDSIEIQRRLFQSGMTASAATLDSGTIDASFINYTKGLTDLLVLNDDSTGANFDPNGHYNTTTNEYTVDIDGNYNVEFYIENLITHTSSGTEAWYSTVRYPANPLNIDRKDNEAYPYYIQYQLFKNGVALGASSNVTANAPMGDPIPVASSTFNAANGYTQTQTIYSTINAGNLRLSSGDVISIGYYILVDNYGTKRKVDYVNGSNVTVPVTYTIEAIKSSSTFLKNSANSGDLTNGDNLVLSDYIPKEKKQSDILTDLVKRYGAYISVDPENDRNIVIDTREAYYSKGGSLDWTDKQDYGSKTDIELLSELQNKEFLFTYKSDTDDFNKNYSESVDKDIYGQQTVEFVNEFAQGVKKIESPFSPTPLVYNSPNPCAVVPAIQTAAPKTNLRVLYYGGVIDCINGGWTFGYTVAGVPFTDTFLTYPYAGHLDNPINPTIDINFGENPFSYYSGQLETTNATLYNRFWANYIQQIDEGKLATMSLNLNEVDISFIRHNLNTKIFIKDSYYYINKIIDYNPLEIGTTKVELLKINEGVSFVSDIVDKNDLGNQFQDDMRTPNDGATTDKDIYQNIDLSENSRTVGDGNSIGTGSDYSTITGSNNTIGEDSTNSVINGNNNAIASGVENGFIIGSNDKTLTISGTGYIGEVFYREGKPENVLPYSIYSMLISQDSTDDPTQIVLENNTGEQITLSYGSVGVYSIVTDWDLVENKTVVVSSLNSESDNTLKHVINEATDTITLYTRDSAGTKTDALLDNSFIEIRVYA